LQISFLTSKEQQSKFDDFLEEFDNERPHQALDMKCPAEVYTPAARHYRGLPELAYPFHDRTIQVTHCGRICLHRKKINLSTFLRGTLSASRRWKKVFGWLALWITISATSI
jgi:hypothetical protein